MKGESVFLLAAQIGTGAALLIACSGATPGGSHQSTVVRTPLASPATAAARTQRDIVIAVQRQRGGLCSDTDFSAINGKQLPSGWDGQLLGPIQAKDGDWYFGCRFLGPRIDNATGYVLPYLGSVCYRVSGTDLTVTLLRSSATPVPDAAGVDCPSYSGWPEP